ncbi:MAG: hypothetical protein PUE68_12370 [Kiritimatiellae bacterium]|nr:hypothetical protein [Kiritimatiellia bacterium]
MTLPVHRRNQIFFAQHPLPSLPESQFRQINVPHNVVGVQVSGDSWTDAMVSIAMDNGRTWLYKSSGTLVRQ